MFFDGDKSAVIIVFKLLLFVFATADVGLAVVDVDVRIGVDGNRLILAALGDIETLSVERDCPFDANCVPSKDKVVSLAITVVVPNDVGDVIEESCTEAEVWTPFVVSVAITDWVAGKLIKGFECEKSFTRVVNIVPVGEDRFVVKLVEGNSVSGLVVAIGSPQTSNTALFPFAIHTAVS